MVTLCNEALELALTLREGKAVFEWGQGEPPSNIPLSDTDIINNFNMKSKTGQSKPVRVLFGPVWKIVDGERILERKGELLVGGGPEYFIRTSSQR